MPFDWMEPKRNPEYVRTLKAKREAMYRAEIEERAALLQRLGYTREATKNRLAAQLGWDFEGNGSPLPAAQLDALLERLYGAPARPTARPKTAAK
jgi:hypothetical protein